MSLGTEFQQASIEAVAEFANAGALLKPTTDEYNTLTGLQEFSYEPTRFEYVTVTNQTLPKQSTLPMAGFRQSHIYFTFPAEEVDETWGVMTGVSKTPEMAWTDQLANVWYDEDSEKWVVPYASTYTAHDIVAIEKIIVNDVIVGYYALMEYQEGQ